MEPFHIVIAFLSAGVALFAGLVSFYTGLRKEGEKTDLVFGIMCITIFIFFLSPPMGFIVVDKAPYPFEIIVKRIFNFSFFAIFPWFVFYYTGYKKKILPIIINAANIGVYFIMLATTKDSLVPGWLIIGLFAIGLSIVHGFIAVRHQFRFGETNNAKWFLAPMFIFLILFIVSAVYQTNIDYFIKTFHKKIFYPINLFPLSFIIIMGIRLSDNSIERFRIGKALGLKNRQWESLLENIQLIIVHVEKNGKVKYINPYGIRLLQYAESSEIIGNNWFDYFMPGPETGIIKELFQTAETNRPAAPVYKNAIITKTGLDKMIAWNNELIFDEQGTLTGVMSIGSDITDQETAFERINELKSELEKENLMLKGEPLPESMRQEIVGKSEALLYAIQKARKVASSQASVLLEGETGVGKELFADLIQRTSMRSNEPFIKVNCGALPADLIEDELFGHEKGAFTGAAGARKGRFEMADGGTIFLDEIGELPIALQPKLLRVLQNGEFERVGGQQTIKVDVRIIAATNRDLETEVTEGRFRDDLFYRLNVFPITIPSLRSRKEDIPLLVKFFVDKKSRKHGKRFESISKSDLNLLCEYEWRGNIRELENVIERSIISSDNNILRLDWFNLGIRNKLVPAVPSSLEQVEKEYIVKVLNDCNWRISGDLGAAEKLIMHPNTLRSRMKKLNISRQTST